MKLTKRVGLAALVLVTLGGAASAMTRKGTPHVRFVAVGPMGMKIEGNSSSLNVAGDAKHIAVEVPLATLKTGIGLRDRHMRNEYLEVGKFPKARLNVPLGAIKLPRKGAAIDSSAGGRLTLHGQTHSVRFHYHALRRGADIDVTGSLHLKMTDYGIHVPSYLGVTVKPGVDIDVHFQVQP